MRSFIACPSCDCYTPVSSNCVHCGVLIRPNGLSFPRSAAAALIGLAAVACTGPTPTDDDDTGTETGETGETGDSYVETAVQADYGVAETGFADADGDGFTFNEGDCDDSNADIYPGAPETAGDGIDSNCDGADDT